MRVGILLHPQVSLPLVLLFTDILEKFNAIFGEEGVTPLDPVLFSVRRLPNPALRFFTSIEGRRKLGKEKWDYLYAPPLHGFKGNWRELQPEIDYLSERPFDSVLSSCVGSSLLAAAGLLDGKGAAIHWAWVDWAKESFPSVCWNAQKLVVDSGGIVTAGGYLATVDLALYLIEKTNGRERALAVGKRILADSSRQYQSIYAQQLISPLSPDGELYPASQFVEEHLASAITVGMLADACRMSVRTFHRKFCEQVGATPIQYIQLRRVQRARELLEHSAASLEEITWRVGLQDVGAFRKVFLREMGVTPAEYRRRAQVRRGA